MRVMDGDPDVMGASEDAMGDRENTPEGVTDATFDIVALKVATPVVAIALGEREGGPAEDVAKAEVGNGVRVMDGDPEAVEASEKVGEALSVTTV